MPIYEFKCYACGMRDETYGPIELGPGDMWCPCGEMMNRVYTSPMLSVPFEPHFNHSVGQYVRTERDFDTALSKASEEASNRTGVDHNYVRIDADAKSTSGVTEAGMDESYRKYRELGWTESKKTIIT